MSRGFFFFDVLAVACLVVFPTVVEVSALFSSPFFSPPIQLTANKITKHLVILVKNLFINYECVGYELFLSFFVDNIPHAA